MNSEHVSNTPPGQPTIQTFYASPPRPSPYYELRDGVKLMIAKMDQVLEADKRTVFLEQVTGINGQNGKV